MKNWIVTLPKAVDWDQYQIELAAVADGENEMRYRVPKYFKSAKPGDRCYVAHRGVVKGYMIIIGLEHFPDGFVCATTNKVWPPGKYLKRSREFYPCKPMTMKPFQGIRIFNGGEL